MNHVSVINNVNIMLITNKLLYNDLINQGPRVQGPLEKWAEQTELFAGKWQIDNFGALFCWK